MEPVEIIFVERKELACDGGDGPLGHPRIFLRMGAKTEIDCPYCGRRFVYKPGSDRYSPSASSPESGVAAAG